MTDDVCLPTLLATSSVSGFRLRVFSAAWYDNSLVLLSATGPDTAVKAVRALLYASDIEARFRLELEDSIVHLARAECDGKPVSYDAKVARLAPGAVHLVALARLPGLMPALDDARLFAELNGPRYTTPLLRQWSGWLKRAMMENERIVMAESHNAMAGILRIEPAELDELVSRGVRDGYLRMTT